MGYGAIIHSPWKLIKAHSGNPEMKEKENILFNILKDSAERNNIKNEEPDAYNDLIKKVRPFDNIKPAQQVPTYGGGRKGFVAPNNWLIKN